MTCSRVAIINRGRIVATNSPENLMAQLTGGAGYEVEVDGDVQELQKLLQILPGISLVEIIPTDELPPGRSLLRIVSSPGTEPGRDIAAVTIGAGLGLHEMRRTRATLEDVFLELITREQALSESEAEQAGTEPDSSELPTAAPSGGNV